MAFQENFKHLLGQKGVSCYQMAKELGKSRLTVLNWKNGKSLPTAQSLLEIGAYFAVPLEDLLAERG